MRMQHKQTEDPGDLVLKFRQNSPQVPFSYKPFATHTSSTSKSPAVDEDYTEPVWGQDNSDGNSMQQQTSIQSTQKMFQNKIKVAEAENALQASLKRPTCAWKQRPMSDIYSDVFLEPGPEPEMCFAPKPTLENKISLVETLEANIKKQLQTEPARIPPGGVRLIPVKREPTTSLQPKEKRFSVPVEFRPEIPLEPFPFTVAEHTDTSPRQVVGPPATPSKFIKGTFSDTNYESDFSDYSYFEKKFKHVNPPRPKSTEPQTQPETPGFDFGTMPLKQMIQRGSPIPLPNPNTAAAMTQKPRTASGYAADTEDQTFYGDQAHVENRTYNQVGSVPRFFS